MNESHKTLVRVNRLNGQLITTYSVNGQRRAHMAARDEHHQKSWCTTRTPPTLCPTCR